MLFPLLGIVASLIYLLSFVKKFKKVENFPPGPSGRFSNLVQFGANPLKTLTLWKKEYGPVVGCRIGEFRVVILNDPLHITKALASPALNSRPPYLPAALYVGGQNHGTLTSAAEVWRAVRDCMVKNMKRLHTSPLVSNASASAAGESNHTSTLSQDMAPLLATLGSCSSSSGETLSLSDVRRLLYIPIATLVWRSLTDTELPEEAKIGLEAQLLRLQKALWQPLNSPVWFLPTLAKWLPSGKQTLTEIQAALSPLHKIVDGMVQRVQQEEEDETENDSFVHSFLKGARTYPCLKGSEANHLKGSFFVLWHTAIETVGNLFAWSLLWLSLNPEKQEILSQELGEIDLNEDLDLKNLPYTRALLQEVLRLSSTAPFANFHWSVQDYTLPNGMVIPMETIVIANLYGVHHDEAAWGEDVEVFRPERFLSTETNDNQRRWMLPFSAGLRTCPGQNFARNFVLYALTKLLRDFRFGWNKEKAKPTPEEILEKSHVSIFKFVPNFEVVVSRRESVE